MKKLKGFTIIELLVVVAIIAVLAAIVLVNVTAYINRGRNAAIKGNLATVQVNQAVHFDNNNGTYSGFCESADYNVPAAAISQAGGTPVCQVNTFGTNTCACSTLVGSTDTFCVDSTGAKKQTSTACDTVCQTAAGATCQ